jgi:hypothetical protein
MDDITEDDGAFERETGHFSVFRTVDSTIITMLGGHQLVTVPDEALGDLITVLVEAEENSTIRRLMRSAR